MTHYYNAIWIHRTSQFFNVSAWNIGEWEGLRIRKKENFDLKWTGIFQINGGWWEININKMTTNHAYACILWVTKADCLVEYLAQALLGEGKREPGNNCIRPGPNIPLNLPIIQIIILHLSTPLFKWKLKKDKMQMIHEYDQNLHACTFWPTSAGSHENFLFIISSEAKGTFSTPKNEQQLVIWAVWSSASFN